MKEVYQTSAVRTLFRRINIHTVVGLDWGSLEVGEGLLEDFDGIMYAMRKEGGDEVALGDARE